MIFPIRNDAVQLVSETVEVRLPGSPGEAGRAECTYRLMNLTASPQIFEMAFMTSEPRGFPPELPSQMYRDANFRVEMDGGELPFRFEGLEKGRWAEIEMSPPDSLPVWEVTIPRGETVNLHMTYDVLWSGGADGSHLHREFSYRARPAALWAGVVEEAEVSFLFDELTARLLRCLPGSDGGCFRWKIEPEG